MLMLPIYRSRMRIRQRKMPHDLMTTGHSFILFHPDYTVGHGIAPCHAFRLADFTAGGDLPVTIHPASKILMQFFS